MNEKMTGRQRQALQTKAKILSCARRLVAEKQISDITIQEIIDSCGISVGTFYHYFASKEYLCASIALAPGTEILDEVRHSDALRVSEKLRRFIMGRLQLAESDGLAFTRNIQSFRLTETYRAIRNEQYGVSHFDYTALMDIFRHAMDRGELKEDFPADTFAQTIVYLVHGAIYNLCLFDEELHLTEWGRSFCDYMEKTMLATYLSGAENE